MLEACAQRILPNSYCTRNEPHPSVNPHTSHTSRIYHTKSDVIYYAKSCKSIINTEPPFHQVNQDFPPLIGPLVQVQQKYQIRPLDSGSTHYQKNTGKKLSGSENKESVYIKVKNTFMTRITNQPENLAGTELLRSQCSQVQDPRARI